MICNTDQTWDTVNVLTPIECGDIHLKTDDEVIKRAKELWYDEYWKAPKGSQKEVATVIIYNMNSDELFDKDGDPLPENKTCTVMQHNISYYFRDTELDIEDSGMEHIAYMISQDFSSGELAENIDPEQPEETFYGWWEIDN